MKILPVQAFNKVNQVNHNPKFNNIVSFNNDTFEKNNNLYSAAIPFCGITGKGIVKQRGLLFHITSLPAERSFCGQFLDEQTNKFIKWMADSKQTHWIMNPLNALGLDLCPYSSLGRFSRNKFIVNLNKLTGKEYGKLLKENELPDDIYSPTFTLEMLEKQKNPRFELAYSRFKNLDPNHPIKKEYNKFLKENDTLWLDDYANYDMLARKCGYNWKNWIIELQTAPEDAKREGISLNEKIISILTKADNNVDKQKISDHVNQYKFEQFLFDKQFNETVQQLKENNINLIMDLPIGVSPIGVDTWGKKNIFILDKNFNPPKVSGCPSESNYKYTQVWGHALYDYDSPAFWEYQEKSLKQLLKNADLRLDHFVGYINRAAIPTKYVKDDGTVLYGHDIFKSVEDGGMGRGFFKPEWIENIDEKRSPKGENIFELFMRVAEELNKRPEDTYILENFGPLAKTEAYKAFDKKYGKNFISQRVPIGMGMKIEGKRKDKLNSPFKIKNSNIALLTGNHDLPSLRESIDELLNKDKKTLTPSQRRSHKLFLEFCEKELKLTNDEIKNPDIVFENTMKWFYTRNVKQVQTTLQDALGIYYRPNIPGFWNGMYDKYLMKPTKEALLPYWSRVFPKDFLSREDKNGYTPGYKSLAEKFVNMINELYPKEK